MREGSERLGWLPLQRKAELTSQDLARERGYFSILGAAARDPERLQALLAICKASGIDLQNDRQP